MKTVSSCPSCAGTASRCGRALVAPFIAKRIWGRDPFEIALMKCAGCGFYFFNPRLEPEEETRLYTGYRGPEYQGMRQDFEPWYTPHFNQKITDPDFLKLRKSKVSEILSEHLPNGKSLKILDFGGAQGELVKDLIPGALPYVYDVSGVQPLPGVRSCPDLNHCRSLESELIISSNVLEHVGSPRSVVQQMRQVAASGTVLWVEVPHESPEGSPLILRRLIQEACLVLLRPRVALSLARPGALHLMHEHVNFFNLQSLETLLRCSGWDVTDSGTYGLRGPLGQQEWVWALAKAGPSTDDRLAPITTANFHPKNGA